MVYFFTNFNIKIKQMIKTYAQSQIRFQLNWWKNLARPKTTWSLDPRANHFTLVGQIYHQSKEVEWLKSCTGEQLENQHCSVSRLFRLRIFEKNTTRPSIFVWPSMSKVSQIFPVVSNDHVSTPNTPLESWVFGVLGGCDPKFQKG